MNEIKRERLYRIIFESETAAGKRFVTSEMVKANAAKVVCGVCNAEMQPEAKYCSHCGVEKGVG